MFRKSTEQQIMREADKVVSMKEDIDAMSWSRVGEIAKLLQVDHTEEQRLEWARELLSIARTNSWVLDKFGVSAENMTGRVIPSGIEVQQGDRYLSETTAADMPSAEDVPATNKNAEVAIPLAATAFEAEPGRGSEPEPKHEPQPQPQLQPELQPQSHLKPQPQHQSEPQPVPVSPAPESDGTFIETKGVLKKKRRVEKQSRREKREVEPFSIPTAAPAENAVLDFEQIATPGFGQDATSLEDLRGRVTVARTSASDVAPSAVAPAAEPVKPSETSASEPMGKNCSSEAIAEKLSSETVLREESAARSGESVLDAADGAYSIESTSTAAANTDPSESPSDATRRVDPNKPASESASQNVARFKHLYSNRKGSLCLYEDSEGHLVAVDPSRFA